MRVGLYVVPFARFTAVALLVAAVLAPAVARAASHPMDPLTADEIAAAANILLAGRAAQSGAGPPQYISDNASIVNQDIVLWHTLTFHHVTAAEDFPVLPRERESFEIKPHNFFDHNPALDLRRAPFEVAP
jgi:Cu2+-containing amine oxidase